MAAADLRRPHRRLCPVPPGPRAMPVPPARGPAKGQRGAGGRGHGVFDGLVSGRGVRRRTSRWRRTGRGWCPTAQGPEALQAALSLLDGTQEPQGQSQDRHQQGPILPRARVLCEPRAPARAIGGAQRDRSGALPRGLACGWLPQSQGSRWRGGPQGSPILLAFLAGAGRWTPPAVGGWRAAEPLRRPSAPAAPGPWGTPAGSALRGRDPRRVREWWPAAPARGRRRQDSRRPVDGGRPSATRPYPREGRGARSRASALCPCRLPERTRARACRDGLRCPGTSW